MALKSTPTGLVLRKAKRLDFPSIIELNHLTKRPERTDTRFSEYFVAETTTGIVGCAALRCRRRLAYLYGLTVHPLWRRKGIGHTLTDLRLEIARAKQNHSAFVLAMFWNVKFFKRHGFALAQKQRTAQLRWLHQDFDDKWSRYSALLCVSLAPPSSLRRSPQ